MSCQVRPKIRIRPFRPEDQDDSRDLILSGLGEHFGHIDPKLNPDIDDIQTLYLSAGHQFVVATIDTGIVGTGGLLAENQEEGRIVRVSVDRQIRGQGIGRAIVNHLVSIARDRGFKRILVETNKDWYPAISLYRRAGFVLVSEDTESAHLVLNLDSRSRT